MTPYAGNDAASFIRPGTSEFPSGLFGRSLTRRQREILQLVAEGKTTNDISARLGISSKTVEYHRGRLMDELGVDCVAGLVRYAVAHGIISA